MISILKIYTSGLSGSRTLTRFFASCLVTVLEYSTETHHIFPPSQV